MSELTVTLGTNEAQTIQAALRAIRRLNNIAAIRMAGYYTAGQEDPDEAERHPWAAQPGNKPTVTDLLSECNHLRARAVVAEQKLAAMPQSVIEDALNYVDASNLPLSRRTVEVWRWLETLKQEAAHE